MKHYSSVILMFFLLFVNLIPSFAQETGSIRGIVLDFNDDKPLQQVIVKLEGTTITAHTDNEGQFILTSVPVGKYNIVCMKANYYSSISDAVMVKSSSATNVEIKMLPGNPEKFLYFSIGGIIVTAEKDLIPESHETVHKISSGEIEHMQATNLGDLLDLVPGIERKNQPGLQGPSQVALRGATTSGSGSESSYDEPDLFGTRIIVDDVPISNNANLNTGTGVGYGSSIRDVANTGVDLRQLPADNINNVEVISGVPSVEYGDVTSGIVKVETKSEADPLRLKMKNNPNTREMNLGGGFNLSKKTVFNFNLNTAYGLKDIRLSGDEVLRINAQGRFHHKLKDEKLKLSEKIAYTRWVEDYSVKDDPNATTAYNHDFKLNLSQITEYKPNKNSTLYFRGYLNYTHRESFKKSLNVIDPSYVTDRRTNGTQEGLLLTKPYYYEITTTGKEYNLGFKLNYKQRVHGFGMIHNFLFGSEYVYDGNKGPGKQFDPLKPLSVKSGMRPRSFDDTPGFDQLSFYAENRITGTLGFPFTFTLGLRGESYNPEGFGGSDLIKGQNGTFWNPRTGLKLKFHPNFQIRGSYGRSSKAPSLSSIYPDPVYLDILEAGADGLNSLVTTYVYPLTNENLQGYTQDKYEAAVDFKFRKIGITVNGFRQETKNSPVRGIDLPYVRNTYAWPNWPSPDGRYLVSSQNEILSGYDYADNLGWVKRDGAEISIRTQRIEPLHMRFRISGSYTYKKWGQETWDDVATPRDVYFNGDTTATSLFPIYQRLGGWRKKLIMNYNLDYINKNLGIWMTFTVYHKAYDKKRLVDSDNNSNYATGYYSDGAYYSLDAESADELGLVSTITENDKTPYKTPSTFYFNLTISKSIYEGAEISLFLNNLFNSRNFYYDRNGSYRALNPEIFYGIEFSMHVFPIAQYIKRKL